MDMSVWFLIGAALVFFMQCGFAMVEAGFTRAKNAGNIIMKNLMDFCLGTVAFYLLGFNLLCGEGSKFAGWGLNPFANFAETDWSSFVFNLVFCATAATIVSGAMAERTKFITYCIYSFIISLFIYPIEAHWIWGGTAWLTDLGFVDFAGSCAIHMVGGIAGLIGAAFLGPRIGKYDASGKSKPILGHNIVVGALGVFILWFGWYGFNGAAASDTVQLAQIFATTTVAPAAASCTAMIYTWIKNGKPDVSMTLNGSLAGLVAITAGCANVDVVGAFIIGAIAGVLVCVVIYTLETKIRIDDPVGAVGVHGACGMFGTLAVGLFDYKTGLFYGGGFYQLGIQALGVLCVGAWTVVMMLILFTILKKTIGIRVSKEEEVSGLDSTEHGLESAYPDFQATNYKQ
ncbi:MAG: ammonium transporter [Lachnospiraceae bacterium]|nr:ammonium transporter [Lachnospiraceae bacterium]